MKSASDYMEEIESILGTKFKSGKADFHLSWEGSAERNMLKKRIGQMQKELRLLKKDLLSTMKIIRSDYIAKKAEVGTKLTDGLGAAIFGKKFAGKSNAIKKENIRRQQINALSSYDSVKSLLDSILIQLDGVKIKIDQDIIEEKNNQINIPIDKLIKD